MSGQPFLVVASLAVVTAARRRNRLHEPGTSRADWAGKSLHEASNGSSVACGPPTQEGDRLGDSHGRGDADGVREPVQRGRVAVDQRLGGFIDRGVDQQAAEDERCPRLPNRSAQRQHCPEAPRENEIGRGVKRLVGRADPREIAGRDMRTREGEQPQGNQQDQRDAADGWRDAHGASAETGPRRHTRSGIAGETEPGTWCGMRSTIRSLRAAVERCRSSAGRSGSSAGSPASSPISP